MSGNPIAVFVALAAVLLHAVGCSVERHYIQSPGTSQTIRVESGDRLFMDLPEDRAAGYQWYAKCNDRDVEVRIDHDPSEADVTIRIHRGYDGPSAVNFFYKRASGKEPVKAFTITLFKRTGDCAFWK